MTLIRPLFVQQVPGDPQITYTAQELRTVIDALVGTPGVCGAGDLAVTQRGAGANFSVDVAAGHAVVTGTSIADQGKYVVQSTATVNLTLSGAPGAGFNRFDLVYAQVRDRQADGGTSYDWVIDKVTGTSSGVTPSTPGNAIPLAVIGPVVSTTTSITTGLIKDLRVPMLTGAAPQFLFDVQNGSGSAASSTRVNVIATQSFRLTATRRVKFTVSADSCTGDTGGETGRLVLNLDAAEVRRGQWQNQSAGGSGDLGGTFITHTASLPAGDHTVKVDVLRVALGSQVNVSGVSLLAEILRT